MPPQPTSPRSKKPKAPPGFRIPPKPQRPPISQMTLRELKDLHYRNSNVLSAPSSSSASYVPRIMAEQKEIESRLLELEGVDSLGKILRTTSINGEHDMPVDIPPEPYVSPTVLAKRNALARYSGTKNIGNISSITIDFREAAEIERRVHAEEQERQRIAEERKAKHAVPKKDRTMTREEYEARVWAFMTAKPSDSDLEDDDEDEDEDDDDPSNWFDDDQDDGIKGQDIIFPDAEELEDVIRMDHSQISYSTFYEPLDEG